MKTLKASIFTLILSCLFILQVQSQHDTWHWEAGASYGMMNYHGDLSYKFKKLPESEPSFGLHWGILNPKGKSWRIMYNNGSIRGNDRVVNRFGTVLEENTLRLRSLNFKTEIWDISLSRIWYGYNSNLTTRRQKLTPYAGIGLGYTNFDVYGDLLYGEDRRYYYWTDGTIRDASQSQDNPATSIIELDGEYETNLSTLKTESDELYSTAVLHIPLTLGFRFSLSERLNLDLETNIKYSFTDHLDDVSDAPFRTDTENFDNTLQAFAINPANVSRDSRGNDNGANDWYTYSNLTLTYNFGERVNRPLRNTLPEPQVEIPTPAPVIVEEEVKTYESYTEKVSTVDDLRKEIEDIKSQMAQNNNDMRVSLLEGEMVKLKEKFRSLGGSSAPSETRISVLEDRLNSVVTELERLNEKLNEAPAPRVIYTEPAPTYSAPVYVEPAPAVVYSAPVITTPAYQPITVYFSSGQSISDSMTKSSLDTDVINLLRSNPSVNVHIKGYADKTGSSKMNLIISEQRANSVKTYILKQGIDLSRVRTSYYGSEFEGVTSDISSRKVVIEFE